MSFLEIIKYIVIAVIVYEVIQILFMPYFHQKWIEKMQQKSINDQLKEFKKTERRLKWRYIEYKLTTIIFVISVICLFSLRK